MSAVRPTVHFYASGWYLIDAWRWRRCLRALHRHGGGQLLIGHGTVNLAAPRGLRWLHRRWFP